MVANRKIYFVSPSSGSWVVTHQDRTLSTHRLKDAAVTEGRRVAKANAPSQLRVMRADGTIEFENTYENDPYPPVG